MFCTNCGTVIEEGNAFCTNCGARVDVPPEDTAESVAEGAVEETITESAEETVDGDVVESTNDDVFEEIENEIAETDGTETPSEEALVSDRLEALEEEVATGFAEEVVNPPISGLDVPSNEVVEQFAAELKEIGQVESAAAPEAYQSSPEVLPMNQMPAAAPLPAQAAPVAAMPMTTPPLQPQPMQQQPMQPMQPMQSQMQPKKSNKGLIIGIVAVVVVIGAILAYVFGIGPALKAGKEYDVQLVTAGSAIESTATTPAAISIKGTVLSDNSEYKTTVYVSGTDTVKLHEGTYTATAVAPVLASDGTLIGFSPENISFEVTEQNGSYQLLFTAAPVENAQLTESLISLAASMALESGESQSLVDNYVKLAKEKLAAAQKAAQDAEARRQAEEAAKKKAEEEAKAHTSGATWYVCASDFVTMRVSPSTSARAITRINSRVAVTYLGEAGGGWTRIRYNGQEGYVLTRFISYDRDAPLDYGDV